MSGQYQHQHASSSGFVYAGGAGYGGDAVRQGHYEYNSDDMEDVNVYQEGMPRSSTAAAAAAGMHPAEFKGRPKRSRVRGKVRAGNENRNEKANASDTNPRKKARTEISVTSDGIYERDGGGLGDNNGQYYKKYRLEDLSSPQTMMYAKMNPPTYFARARRETVSRAIGDFDTLFQTTLNGTMNESMIQIRRRLWIQAISRC